MLRFLQSDTVILFVWPSMCKSIKITSLLFLLDIVRNKLMRKLIFYMQVSMKACYKLILWFWFWWDGQAFPKFLKKQGCDVFTISQKRSQRWSWFFVCRSSKFPISTLWALKSPKGGPIIIDGHDQAFSKYSK